MVIEFLYEFYVIDRRFFQNPAFGASQIRELTDTFIEKSIQVSFDDIL